MNNIDINTMSNEDIQNMTQNINIDNIEENTGTMIDSLNDIRNMVQNSELMTCDAACKRDKEERAAYNNFLLQTTNLENAPKQFQEAEREYVTLTKGSNYYNTMKLDEYKNTAKNIMSNFDKKYSEIETLVREKIKINKHVKTSEENAKDLQTQYIDKSISLRNDLENAENTGNIANRNSYYDNKKIGFLCSINYYIKVFFWIIFLSYVIIAFVYNRYSDTITMIGLLIIPVLAFFSGSTIFLRKN